MFKIKQLYEGAAKTPFYPKVPLKAIDGIEPDTTLEDNVKTISQTVYGTTTPGTTSSTTKIDTVPEVYDFLDGITKDKKLSDLISNAGGSSSAGSKVSVIGTYNKGTSVANVKVDGNDNHIRVPASIVSDFMTSTTNWRLLYNNETTLLKLLFNDVVLASTHLDNSAQLTIQYFKPNAPTEVVATYNSTNNSITVAWCPVDENSTSSTSESIDTYSIQRYVNGNTYGNAITVSTSTTDVRYDSGKYNWTDTEIIAGFTHEYVIYAVSAHDDLVSDASAKSNPVTTSSDEEDTTKAIWIAFLNDEVSNYEYTGSTFTNILRLMSPVETYVGTVSVFGSMATLNKVSYAKVQDFDGNEHVVQLGPAQVSGNTYCKMGTVTFTRNNRIQPSNTTLALYAMPSTGSTYIVYGSATYNFVYPIYTGYVEKDVWEDAVSGDEVDSSVTVIAHGNSLGGLDDGYHINNETFNCNLTTSQKNDSSFTHGYMQVAIPLNQYYMGYGVTTDSTNMPSVFKTTSGVDAEILGMHKDMKRVVSSKGVTYWVYTAYNSSLKTRIPSDGSTIKAVV